MHKTKIHKPTSEELKEFSTIEEISSLLKVLAQVQYELEQRGLPTEVQVQFIKTRLAAQKYLQTRMELLEFNIIIDNSGLKDVKKGK